MSEKEAIRLASECARRRRRDTGRYEAAAELDGGEWRVDFRPREAKPDPGDFFTVYVDDATGAARGPFEGK